MRTQKPKVHERGFRKHNRAALNLNPAYGEAEIREGGLFFFYVQLKGWFMRLATHTSPFYMKRIANVPQIPAF